MNKGNLLAVLFGILFCIGTGFFIKFKQNSMQENLAPAPALKTKQAVKIKVRKGWCLSRIADGLGTSIKDLVALNKIEDPDLIYTGQTIKVAPYDRTNKVEVSWYGPKFHGKKMSNGKIFNMEDSTVVAHKLLPFGTKVKLTRIDNGKSIVAIVQDRGPYVRGRDFDISRKAAEHLGITRLGIAPCEVKILN